MDCLDYMSWAEIKANGKFASAIFNLGDYKNCRLKNGEEVQFHIIGFNHDKTKNGVIVPMTWEMVDALSFREFAWNEAGNTDGSWAACSLRREMNDPGGAVFDLFPDDLLEVVVPVIKQTANTFDGSNEIIETEDKFWIISEKELTGRCGLYSAPGEGHWYEYYRLEDVPYGKKRNGRNVWSLLRSPTSDPSFNKSCVRTVNTSGAVDSSYANFANGVVPACAF